MNLGEITSSGLELALTWNVIEKSGFSYNMTLTPSYSLSNDLVSLSGSFNGADLNYGVRDLGAMGSPGMSAVPVIRAEEGKPIGQLLAFVYEGVGEDGNLKLTDLNEDGKIDNLDRTVVGNGLPKLVLGFGNNFTYKNWDMNIFLRGIFGHDLNNTWRAFYEIPYLIKSYNLPPTAVDQKNPTTGTYLNNTSGILSDHYIEKADFITLDNISLGYNFNLPKGGQFSKIRLYLAGNNLFYITKYKGADPNPRYLDNATDQGTFNNPLVPGMDRRNTWFRTRAVTFGANIVF
jgi:iron complex outermembrane receptor protein